MRDARFGDVVVSMKNGLYKPATEYANDGTPCLRMYNIDAGSIVWRDIKRMRVSAAELEEYGLREGDLLVNRVNSRELVGKAAFIPPSLEPSVFESKNIRVRLDASKALPKFINYQLLAGSRRHFAGNAQQVVGMASISQKQLADFPIVLTDLDEQRHIVAELEKQFSRLDEAVANLKRVKANLKRQTAAIFSAAIGGGLLGHAAFQTQTDRPDFAPAIGLPSRWSWASAAEVCEIVASGSTPKPEEMTSGAGEVPFIKVYNLGFDGSLDFTVKPTFIRRAIHEGPLARSRCLPGDVLMNIVGPPLGKVSLVPDAFPEWNINQAVVTFRAGPRILNRLLAYWLMSPPVQRRIEKTAKATAGQHNVQVSTCRKLVLPLPPLDEQRRIVAEVDRRLSIVREVEAEVDANLKRAQSLRQAVLARAFAG